MSLIAAHAVNADAMVWNAGAWPSLHMSLIAAHAVNADAMVWNAGEQVPYLWPACPVFGGVKSHALIGGWVALIYHTI